MDIRKLTQRELEELAYEKIEQIDFTFGYNKVFKEYCEERANILGLTWEQYMVEEQTKQLLNL
jgi:hypothetical protein